MRYNIHMKLIHVSRKILDDKLKRIVSRYVNLSEYRLFYFGSRVTGHGDERSDIDVGLYGKIKVPEAAFANIQDDIENLPFLYSIDIVDFNQTSEDFRNVALQNIEVI